MATISCYGLTCEVDISPEATIPSSSRRGRGFQVAMRGPLKHANSLYVTLASIRKYHDEPIWVVTNLCDDYSLEALDDLVTLHRANLIVTPLLCGDTERELNAFIAKYIPLHYVYAVSPYTLFNGSLPDSEWQKLNSFDLIAPRCLCVNQPPIGISLDYCLYKWNARISNFFAAYPKQLRGSVDQVLLCSKYSIKKSTLSKDYCFLPVPLDPSTRIVQPHDDHSTPISDTAVALNLYGLRAHEEIGAREPAIYKAVQEWAAKWKTDQVDKRHYF